MTHGELLARIERIERHLGLDNPAVSNEEQFTNDKDVKNYGKSLDNSNDKPTKDYQKPNDFEW